MPGTVTGYNTSDGFAQGGTAYYGGTLNSVRAGTAVLAGGSILVTTTLGTINSAVAVVTGAGTANASGGLLVAQTGSITAGTFTVWGYLSNGTLGTTGTVQWVAYGQ